MLSRIHFSLGNAVISKAKTDFIRAFLRINSELGRCARRKRQGIGSEEIKPKAVLGGVRGMSAVDKNALIDLLTTISSICEAHPEIVELDLDPVTAHANGYSIVDARTILS